MPAVVANDDTACSASCGSNAGLPSGSDSGSSTSHATNGAAGQVEGDLDERLVERVQAAGEAADAGLVAERLAERLAERDGDVLDGVVGVDVQVARGLDGQVEAAVAAELVEHVVVERDAGRQSVTPVPSRSSVDLDRRLLRSRAATRLAADRLIAHGTASSSQGGEEPVVLVRRADRDPQAVGEARPAEQSRTSTPRSTSACQTVVPRSARRADRNSTKLAPLGNDVDRRRRAGASPR